MRINRLDKFASDLYLSLGITKIEDLSIENLSHKFGIETRYSDFGSFMHRRTDGTLIVLDSTEKVTVQRSEFFHELAHYILEHYSSSNKLVTDYFEGKAETLMEYLAIPIHLIEKSEIEINDPNYVQKISEEFGTEFDFTFKRLNKLRDLRDK